MARRRRGLNNEDPELVERRLWYATMEADYAARLDAEAMIAVDTLVTSRPMTSRERGDRNRTGKLERTFSGLMSSSNPTSVNVSATGNVSSYYEYYALIAYAVLPLYLTAQLLSTFML